MAQFDVHRNPGRHADSAPFVVVVQSSQFDGYRRRVVAPLVRSSEMGRIAYPAFNPTFSVNGIAVALDPLDMVAVPLEKLGPPVDSLADHGQAIINALDELFSRAWK
jgi:toxin CcdB